MVYISDGGVLSRRAKMLCFSIRRKHPVLQIELLSSLNFSNEDLSKIPFERFCTYCNDLCAFVTRDDCYRYAESFFGHDACCRP